ncbi:maleate cis-trans isomerase family protein [Azospirillum sp. ST 5-10]|uniref:maleate cis-trans isomerase family protein n=1 Tax=unclassified Azospirillum TaxID=2630922 RepID=UPI003F4A19CD
MNEEDSAGGRPAPTRPNGMDAVDSSGERTAFRRIGMITPSSNTVLEPYTAAILAPLLPRVTAHFARFSVTRIALEEDSRRQFEPDALLAAARQLADARVDVVAWNGTAASWLGFARDTALCDRITGETGIPATTTILALNDALQRLGVTRLGLVTPYLDDVQAGIVANYGALGIEVVAERHLGESGNFRFAEVPEAVVEHLIRAVAEARPQAIAVLCTNFRGTPLAGRLEGELGIPILDSVAVTVWKTLALLGEPTQAVTGWGRLFQALPAAAGSGPT